MATVINQGSKVTVYRPNEVVKVLPTPTQTSCLTMWTVNGQTGGSIVQLPPLQRFALLPLDEGLGGIGKYGV